MEDSSEDIFYPSLIDTYYPQRPKELENISLYEFATWYDVQSNKPVRKGVEYYPLQDGKFIKRRAKLCLVNHYKFKLDSQPEEYYYALLLLFKPWRNTTELKGSTDTYTEMFQSNQT